MKLLRSFLIIASFFVNTIKTQDLVDCSNVHKLNAKFNFVELVDVEKNEQKNSESLIKLHSSQFVSEALIEDQSDVRMIFYQVMLSYQLKCKLKLCDSLPVDACFVPKIIIRSIENKTPYRLVFTDRSRDSFQYFLPQKSRVKLKYEVNNYENMAGRDLKEKAQFAVEVLDSDFEWIIKKSYYNMAIASRKNSEQETVKSDDDFFEFRYSANDGAALKFDCSKKLKHSQSRNVYVSIILALNDKSQIRSLYSHQNVNMHLVGDACCDTIESLFFITEK